MLEPIYSGKVYKGFDDLNPAEIAGITEILKLSKDTEFAKWHMLMKSPHAEFYVIRDDVADKIVSVLLAHDNPNLREKYVSVLVTRPEYRKHGIGKFLIKLFTGFTEGGYIIRFDFPAKHHLFKLYAESGAHINSKPSIGGTLSGFGVVPNREGVKKKLIIPR